MNMTTRRPSGRARAGMVPRIIAPVIALLLALHLQSATAQQGAPQAQSQLEGKTVPDVSELMGAPVFAADGSEVGEVTAVAMAVDGTITEIRVTTASPLGLGTRTVVLPHDRYILLRGAVVVDLSAGEFDGLPTVPGRKR